MFFSAQLSDVLGLLNFKEHQNYVCYITVIPAVVKDEIESDCDRDCSDREYQGKTTGHLPARPLNSETEVTYLEDGEDVSRYKRPKAALSGLCRAL